MKNLLLIALMSLLFTFSSCSKKENIRPDIILRNNSVNVYEGELCKCDSSILWEFDTPSMFDDNIQIYNFDKGWQNGILKIYYAGDGLLHNFELTLNLYDSDKKFLREITITKNVIVQGYTNCLEVFNINDALYYSLVSYKADGYQRYSKALYYELGNAIERKSQTVFHSNLETNLVGILNKDNEIVLFIDKIQKTDFVCGYSNIKGCISLEVD